MKRVFSTLALCHRGRRCRIGGIRADPQYREAARHSQLRRQTGLAGFGVPDEQGNWTGLDVDFCRAMAAAIFNDPTKVKFVPLTAKDRFTALQSGDIDVLLRNTTWTCRATLRSATSPHQLL